MERTLNLRKESLAGLDSDELSQIAGAAPWTPWCPFIIEVTEKVGTLTEPTAVVCR